MQTRGDRKQFIWLTVNSACNMRCGWCYREGSGYSQGDEMSIELATRIIHIARDLKVGNVTIIGGEPTLWPHLFELNDTCRDLSIHSALVTNAMRFGDDYYWASYLKHLNHSVNISFKASNADDLLKYTRVRKFDKVGLGLRRCIERFASVVSFVYAKPCQDKLTDMVLYAKSLGAPVVAIGFCTPSVTREGACGEQLVVTGELISEIVESYDEVHEITGGKFVYAMKYPLCVWPRDFVLKLIERKQIMTTCQLLHKDGIVFDPKGQLILCNSMFEFPVGQIDVDFDDAPSLLSHLSSPQIEQYYDQVRSYPSSKCASCKMYRDCAGGCPLIWTAYRPDELIPGW